MENVVVMMDDDYSDYVRRLEKGERYIMSHGNCMNFLRDGKLVRLVDRKLFDVIPACDYITVMRKHNTRKIETN